MTRQNFCCDSVPKKLKNKDRNVQWGKNGTIDQNMLNYFVREVSLTG